MKIPSLDRSVTLDTRGRGFSRRTVSILQYLNSCEKPVSPQKIAEAVKAPYNSVIKTLGRLRKKDLVKRVLRTFRLSLYELNHDDPFRLSTWVREVSLLGVHRLGLRAVVPGLFDRIVNTGGLVETGLRHGRYYRGPSQVFKADLRLFQDGAYYIRHSEPMPLRSVSLFAEDLRSSLAFHTWGTAPVHGVYMTDFELGVNAEDLFTEPFDGVIIYRKKGRVRVHVLFSGKWLPIPLGQVLTDQQDHRFRHVIEDAYLTFQEVLRNDPFYAKGP